MIEKVKEQVEILLSKDNSGHSMDHINRVLDLSLWFAEKENANKDVVALIALLHDADDYKLFGLESANNLINTRNILEKCFIKDDIQKQVLDAIKTIGYSKRQKGIKPNTLESMVVSDADMCDALGVSGIIREYQYCLKYNKPFFDKDIFPNENVDTSKKCSESCVCHFFEKF